jgi:hypothetical protein
MIRIFPAKKLVDFVVPSNKVKLKFSSYSTVLFGELSVHPINMVTNKIIKIKMGILKFFFIYTTQ